MKFTTKNNNQIEININNNKFIPTKTNWKTFEEAKTGISEPNS
jgi:hypothetical protein